MYFKFISFHKFVGDLSLKGELYLCEVFIIMMISANLLYWHITHGVCILHNLYEILKSHFSLPHYVIWMTTIHFKDLNSQLIRDGCLNLFSP